MTYFIYIIYSSCIDRYYVGYSSNPWNRLIQHNSNAKNKYTGRATDWVLKSTFEAENESGAIQLERFIKKQKSRKLIEQLCDSQFTPNGYLAQLIRVPHMRD
jgi:putative endonuclease